jgi:hypothetical protein
MIALIVLHCLSITDAVGRGEKKPLHCMRFHVCLLASTSRSYRLYQCVQYELVQS